MPHSSPNEASLRTLCLGKSSDFQSHLPATSCGAQALNPRTCIKRRLRSFTRRGAILLSMEQKFANSNSPLTRIGHQHHDTQDSICLEKSQAAPPFAPPYT
ncbi:hypothetical protein O181_005287 [Austropuccinia psidii MF-1]|uniref:Uncharacterized protein n=1 Tax=Austropuccinia psidii MF-1 TaxID=1389203 RepID=A0A9Q3BIG7_9BASI|nr:hypothetical protein [Austropuccinia psidii MF-1]